MFYPVLKGGGGGGGGHNTFRTHNLSIFPLLTGPLQVCPAPVCTDHPVTGAPHPARPGGGGGGGVYRRQGN